MRYMYVLHIAFICLIYQRRLFGLIGSSAQGILCSSEINGTQQTENKTDEPETTTNVSPVETNTYKNSTNSSTSEFDPVTSFITIGLYFSLSSIVAVYFFHLKRKKEKQKAVEEPLVDSQDEDENDPPKPTKDVYVTAVPDIVVESSDSSEDLDNQSEKDEKPTDIPEIVVTETAGDSDSVSDKDTTSAISIDTGYTDVPETMVTDTIGNSTDSIYDSGLVSDKNGDTASSLGIDNSNINFSEIAASDTIRDNSLTSDTNGDTTSGLGVGTDSDFLDVVVSEDSGIIFDKTITVPSNLGVDLGVDGPENMVSEITKDSELFSDKGTDDDTTSVLDINSDNRGERADLISTGEGFVNDTSIDRVMTDTDILNENTDTVSNSFNDLIETADTSSGHAASERHSVQDDLSDPTSEP